MPTVNEVSLDWKAQEVLEAIVENGGEASTSEVKSYTGLERNEVIKYRFGKLSEAGLVETHQPASNNGRPSAKVARLTDDAEELLDGDGGVDLGVDVGDDDLTIDERMTRLEKQFNPIRDSYGEVKKRIADLEKTVEEYDGELDDIVEEIENVKRAMDTTEEKNGLATELEFGDN